MSIGSSASDRLSMFRTISASIPRPWEERVRRTHLQRLLNFACVVLAFVVSACSPSASPASPFAEPGVAPAARKVLTIAARQELSSFADFTGLGSAGGGHDLV